MPKSKPRAQEEPTPAQRAPFGRGLIWAGGSTYRNRKKAASPGESKPIITAHEQRIARKDNHDHEAEYYSHHRRWRTIPSPHGRSLS
jgi:hypothetical protein